MEVSSHALELHRVDAVVYDVARSPTSPRTTSTSTGRWSEYFAAKAGCSPPSARAAASSASTTSGAGGWPRRRPSRSTTVTSRPDVAADWRVEPRTRPTDRRSTWRTAERPAALRSALPGDFNRVNTAVAALVLAAAACRRRLGRARSAPSRTCPGGWNGSSSTPASTRRRVVDFAHTADAVARPWPPCAARRRGPLIAVLGAGGDRDPGKREAMGAAAADVRRRRRRDRRQPPVRGPGDDPRRGARRSPLRGGCHRHRPARGRRPSLPRSAPRSGWPVRTSTVAVLGKGHETGQEVHGTVHPFDDREELHAALTERASTTARTSNKEHTV